MMADERQAKKMNESSLYKVGDEVVFTLNEIQKEGVVFIFLMLTEHSNAPESHLMIFW